MPDLQGTPTCERSGRIEGEEQVVRRAVELQRDNWRRKGSDGRRTTKACLFREKIEEFSLLAMSF